MFVRLVLYTVQSAYRIMKFHISREEILLDGRRVKKNVIQDTSDVNALELFVALVIEISL